jgi:hypothetical protein
VIHLAYLLQRRGVRSLDYAEPDQIGRSCFLVTKGPHDSCTVERDSYTGEIAVKRIQ